MAVAVQRPVGLEGSPRLAAKELFASPRTNDLVSRGEQPWALVKSLGGQSDDAGSPLSESFLIVDPSGRHKIVFKPASGEPFVWQAVNPSAVILRAPDWALPAAASSTSSLPLPPTRSRSKRKQRKRGLPRYHSLNSFPAHLAELPSSDEGSEEDLATSKRVRPQGAYLADPQDPSAALDESKVVILTNCPTSASRPGLAGGSGSMVDPYSSASASRPFREEDLPLTRTMSGGIVVADGLEVKTEKGQAFLKVSPKRGIVLGDGPIKEQAAYFLDHSSFSGVPRTVARAISLADPAATPSAAPRPRHLLTASSSPPACASNGASCPAGDAMRGLTKSASAIFDSASTRRQLLAGPGPMDLSPSLSPPSLTLDKALTQYGSLQEYVENEGTAEDIGPSAIPADEVHKLGILDLRVVNLDRHLGNILVSREASGAIRLVPIDHSYILPDYRELSDLYFEWLYWPQTKIPFSTPALAYIASLDPRKDATLLRELGVREESVLSCVIGTILLQRCAAAGMTLHEIASLMQRPGYGPEKSVLEQLVDSTRAAMSAPRTPASSLTVDSPNTSPTVTAVLPTDISAFSPRIQPLIPLMQPQIRHGWPQQPSVPTLADDDDFSLDGPSPMPPLPPPSPFPAQAQVQEEVKRPASLSAMQIAPKPHNAAVAAVAPTPLAPAPLAQHRQCSGVLTTWSEEWLSRFIATFEERVAAHIASSRRPDSPPGRGSPS